jgi:hypothetical protein
MLFIYKGPFKTLYDLRKVTGFNTRLISALGPYLALESSHIATPNGQQQTQNGNLHSKKSDFFLLKCHLFLLLSLRS